MSSLKLPPAVTTSLDCIRELVKTEFERVNSLILANLHCDVELIHEICQHIIRSGGKRLRPLITLLSAKAFGYEGEAHIKLAVIIEFIHTATLLHDDVVDKSSLRRGHPTANALWGNQTSILVGDFLYSRAFQLMMEVPNLNVMQVLANTTNTIAQGEVLQLLNRNNPDTSQAHYLEVIRAKTAVLFGASAECGAIIADRSAIEHQAMSTYGVHLGMAFQMIDDWLDYAESPNDTGKNIGDDLAEGKLTLPLIYAMQHGTASESAMIKEAIRMGGLSNLDAILHVIESTQAFNHVHNLAQHHVDLAKKALPTSLNSPYHEALLSLAQLALDRKT